MRSLMLIGGAVVVLLVATLTYTVSAAAPAGPAASALRQAHARASSARAAIVAPVDPYRRRPQLMMSADSPSEPQQDIDVEELEREGIELARFTELKVYDRRGRPVDVEVGIDGGVDADLRPIIIWASSKGSASLPVAPGQSRPIRVEVAGELVAETELADLPGYRTKTLSIPADVIECRLFDPQGEPAPISAYSVFESQAGGTGSGRGGGSTMGVDKIQLVWWLDESFPEFNVRLTGDQLEGTLTLTGPEQSCVVVGRPTAML